MKETYYDTALLFLFFVSTAPSALLLPQFFLNQLFSNFAFGHKGLFKTQISRRELL